MKTISLDDNLTGEGSSASINVIESSEEKLLLEFELPALQIADFKVDEDLYQLISIANGGYTDEVGAPMLPIFSRLVTIPDDCGVRLTVTDIATTTLPDLYPMPLQEARAEGFEINAEIYEGTAAIPADYFQQNGVTVGTPAIARGLRVVPITFSPVIFDGTTRSIQVAKRLRVELDFTSTDLRNNDPREFDSQVDSYNSLYQEMVINYSGSREETSTTLGAYVIICPDATDLIEALAPLIEWRQRKGYEVHLATLTETGSEAEDILAWLQNAYNTWANPPEYVVLIGDADDNCEVFLPTWFESSYLGGEGDKPYVLLDGDDHLSDAHIGRISVDSAAQLQLYVHKIVSYESTPYMADTDWYTRACVTGDPSDSGYTCIQIMQWLKTNLLNIGYTEVDTVFSNPFRSQMIANTNRGITIFAYRGFYAMSHFTTGSVYNLTNGRMMPFAVNLTCETGSFAHGTSVSEAWIRAGMPPDMPTGGIASIGTATGGTHTRYNNCITYGIWQAVVQDGIYEFGPALTRGEYELYLNYSDNAYSSMTKFMHWNNLMGDPAGELWTNVPAALSVSHHAVLAPEANLVQVAVANDGQPQPGAYVCLWQDGFVHTGGYTDENGEVAVPVSGQANGNMKVTVTGHNCYPYLSEIVVTPQDRYVGYLNHNVDDDSAGGSSGNSNGLINPSESIELPVEVQNYGAEDHDDVTGVLTTSDPYVDITTATTDFGSIEVGAAAWGLEMFVFTVDAGTPDGHLIVFDLSVTADADTWHSVIEIPVSSAAFELVSLDLTAFDGSVDPGEVGALSCRLLNNSETDAATITGELISHTREVIVTDDSGDFGSIPSRAEGENGLDRFAVSARTDCFRGHEAAMSLVLTYSSGAVDTVFFSIPVGQCTTSDPTGPDNYGYYAFDHTDTEYEDAPVYDWIELAPVLGGVGTSVGLGDFGLNQDDSKTVELPFSFTYYGERFSRVTICSNGWIAMGSTYLTNYRNWTIPGAGAPPYMIAPMWDNFYQEDENQVYHWFDSVNNLYVIQWHSLANMYNDVESTYQVILYDPTQYPTDTGDGQILFQYKVYQDVDSHQHRSTTGIENETRTDGVLYRYYSDSSVGAIVPGEGTAIKFVPVVHYPHGNILIRVFNQADQHRGIDNAVLTIEETGETMISGVNGFVGRALPPGTWTIRAEHPCCITNTLTIQIVEDQETNLQLPLVDNSGPLFENTTVYLNTVDTVGPYTITSTVIEYSPLEHLTLHYNAGGAGWMEIPLQSSNEWFYTADIPGVEYTTLVHYYLSGEDIHGFANSDPVNPPYEIYSFWVLPPALLEDGEGGTGQMSHYAVTEGYNDLWHLSTQSNHTPDGSSAWKAGDEGGGQYIDDADGVLETQPFYIVSHAEVTFWHRIDSEASEMFPGYAYDGGLIELSIDGGEWTQITPDGGYNSLVRNRTQGPGPFPSETPFYAGHFDWQQEHFVLESDCNWMQLRFRFGSDYAVNDTGWFVDDILIVGYSPGLADHEETAVTSSSSVLYQNNPNPFAASTTGTQMRFSLSQDTAAHLRVVDASGRLVKVLVNQMLPAGNHRVSWDGSDSESHPVGSGVYFYVLDDGRKQITKRLMLVR